MRDLEFTHQFDGGPVEAHDELKGFMAARRAAGSEHERRVQEAARLYADVIKGREDPVLIREAMNPRREVFVRYLAEKYPGLYGNAFNQPGRVMTLQETMAATDYQALTVDVLDRAYYSIFTGFPLDIKNIAKNVTLRDFRVVKRYLLDGGVTPITYRDPAEPFPQRAMVGPVPQKNASITNAKDTSAITYQPLLGQAGSSVNWAAMVNDDLGIFRDRANRLALAANRGINQFYTKLYVDSNGPHASLYTTAYKNQIITANGATSNNPPLNTQGLIDAINVLMQQKDAGGDPIMITGRLRLVYPPALEGTVQNAMNGLNVFVQNMGGTPNTQADAGHNIPLQLLNVRPWMVQRMDPILDPYIPLVATSGNIGKTMWAIFVEPDAQPRPAIEVGFLSGYETPQLFQRAPTTMRPGGGIDPMLGNFDTMDTDLKIISVIGGAQIEGRVTVASNGSGS